MYMKFGNDEENPILDLIEYIKNRAQSERNKQADAKAQKAQEMHGYCASELEFLVMVLERSNLAQFRYIMVDDDIEDAIKEVQIVKNVVDDVSNALIGNASVLQEKLRELLALKSMPTE